MPDILTAEQRYKCMSHIRARDTRPEMIVRKCLFAAGYRYRLQAKWLPGRPDIVLRRLRTVIFVNGCFWHGHENCGYFRMPKTNREFWESKIAGNKERDSRNKRELAALGWNIIEIWECQLKPRRRLQTIESLFVTLNGILVKQIEGAKTVTQVRKSLPAHGYGEVADEILMAAEDDGEENE